MAGAKALKYERDTVQGFDVYNVDNEPSSRKGVLNRYLSALGTTLASYWSYIHKTAAHSPNRQSANYSSITGDLLAERQPLQALHLRQRRRPCHGIIIMMNTAAGLL